MRISTYSLGGICIGLSVGQVVGFTSTGTSVIRSRSDLTFHSAGRNLHHQKLHRHSERRGLTTRTSSSTSTSTSTSTLFMNNGNFDLSKPQFDVFSLRSIRQDALLNYSSLNQSEPLRINLYLILSVALFSFPTLSEAVIGEQANLPAVIGSTAAGFGAVALFFNECNNRLKQLMRIEKELNAEFLSVKLSTTNKFEQSLYGRNSPTVSLKSLRGKKRILTICGPTDTLRDVLVPFRVFRRRIAQAQSLIAVVPTDAPGGIVNLKDLGVTEAEIRSCQWLGEVQDTKAWVEYCQGLTTTNDDTSDNNVNVNGSTNNLVWFGLNYNGRSFASGSGEVPRLLEILGQNLRPTELLDDTDENESTVGMDESTSKMFNQVLESQNIFYDVLTSGNLEGMKSIYSSDDASEVSEIINAGGRIDAWESCLAEGARPAGMKFSGCDALIISPTEAYSTCIEFPANVGGYSDPLGATLLANQRWGRSSKDEDWKLEYHQTIPWSPDTRAGGTLRCDGRGCVALTRGKEKRTFGGLIG